MLSADAKSSIDRIWNVFWSNGMSTSTLAKLSKGEDVNSSILVKICDALQCNIGDIADCVSENGGGERK